MTGREFIRHGKYFELLLEIIDHGEDHLGVRSVYAVGAYLLGYEFAMARAGHVEIGIDRLIPILEEIVRSEGVSFTRWPAALIRRCGSDVAAYEHFRELIAKEAEREQNE